MYFVKTYFNEILKQGDMNVIFVDWEKGATFPYYQASGDTRIVGRCNAKKFSIGELWLSYPLMESSKIKFHILDIMNMKVKVSSNLT